MDWGTIIGVTIGGILTLPANFLAEHRRTETELLKIAADDRKEAGGHRSVALLEFVDAAQQLMTATEAALQAQVVFSEQPGWGAKLFDLDNAVQRRLDFAR